MYCHFHHHHRRNDDIVDYLHRRSVQAEDETMEELLHRHLHRYYSRKSDDVRRVYESFAN